MKYMAHETEILLHETRAAYDAIMVGANTIRIDNSFLTVRLIPAKARSASFRAAWPISLSTQTCSGPMRHPYRGSGTGPGGPGCGDPAKGVTVVAAGKDHVDLQVLMQILHDDFGIKKLMIEGGPTLNWHMLHEKLVDEIRLIHLPFIVGGSGYAIPCRRNAYQYRRRDDPLNLKKYYMCGSNLVSEFDVLYP